MEILLAIILGGFFGFALYYVGATNYTKLLNMLRLKDLSLMKIILFAIGFSSFLLAIASFIGILDISHLDIKTTHLGVVIGGLIFGIGFGWAGTCPGTCIAGSSSGGLKKALVVIIGGLLGAFSYSLSYGSLNELGLFDIMNFGNLTLFKLSDKFPSVFQIGFGGLLIMGLLLMAIAAYLPVNLSFNKN